MSAQPVRNLCATNPRTRMVKPFAQLRNLRNLLIEQVRSCAVEHEQG